MPNSKDLADSEKVEEVIKYNYTSIIIARMKGEEEKKGKGKKKRKKRRGEGEFLHI